ncbi:MULTISPECIES: GumC domain-containing protein [Bacillaceae]|uniref:Wzz/FepE/Etk N-terminal domain-containing protein n=1 Tax=Bacillaceae TaxID=186817 RepID=UPI002965440D|nr:Wzz/FepE/Etk N-terminal domain-containing protein [Bacillus infantis]MDW2876617.1 Wzz/FepE/Etk N-terminal domain-containing protein [Bacillus infantis]
MAEQKKFVLYEYLLFFWKKKWSFLIIPIIFALLGLAASYVISTDAKYTGNATVFTGSIKQKGLTNPDNIVANFGEGVDGEIEVFVSSDSYVKIKIKQDDRKELQKDLTAMSERIENALVKDYEFRKKVTEEYRDGLIARADKLEKSIQAMDPILERDLPLFQYQDLTLRYTAAQNELSEATVAAQRVTNDLAVFEQPSVIVNQVNQADTNRTELTIAGLILGVLFTLVFLIFWKYIIEARRYYNHD